MKLFPLVCLALATALFLALGNNTTPAGASPADGWNQNTWKAPTVQYDIVTSVDASAKKLSIQHQGGSVKQARDLTVDAFTEITIDGKKTDLAALRAGMRVKYTLGGSGTTLSSLATVEPPKPPPTPVATATPSFPGRH